MNSPLLTAPVSRHSCYTKFNAFHSTFHITIVPLSPFQPVVNTPQLLDCSLFNGTHQRTACYVSFKSHFLTAEAMAALSAAHARASLGLTLKFLSAFLFSALWFSICHAIFCRYFSRWPYAFSQMEYERDQYVISQLFPVFPSHFMQSQRALRVDTAHLLSPPSLCLCPSRRI